MSKKRKNVSVVQVFTFLHFEIANGHFHCKTITHMSCYTYNILKHIKTIYFWLKYNGLAIVQKTTKLIGGHHGLQDYGLLRFFKIQKVVTFYVFLPCLVRFLELRSRSLGT